MSSHRSRRLIYTVAAALALFTALTGMASASVPGLGGEMTGAFGQAVFDNMTPNATLTGASISAREVQGGSVNNWKVNGYAICATA